MNSLWLCTSFLSTTSQPRSHFCNLAVKKSPWDGSVSRPQMSRDPWLQQLLPSHSPVTALQLPPPLHPQSPPQGILYLHPLHEMTINYKEGLSASTVSPEPLKGGKCRRETCSVMIAWRAAAPPHPEACAHWCWKPELCLDSMRWQQCNNTCST